MSGSSRYLTELEKIRKAHGGKLTPKGVVDFARDPKTALHKRFDWDDGIAGEKWRLEQAKLIIRVSVTVMPANNGETVRARAYVSLPSDRKSGAGYRTVEQVLSDKSTTEEALASLRNDIASLERKYSVFVALRPMLDALIQAVNVTAPQKATRRQSSGEEQTSSGSCNEAEASASGIESVRLMALQAWQGATGSGAARTGKVRRGRRGLAGLSKERTGVVRHG